MLMWCTRCSPNSLHWYQGRLWRMLTHEGHKMCNKAAHPPGSWPEPASHHPGQSHLVFSVPGGPRSGRRGRSQAVLAQPMTCGCRPAYAATVKMLAGQDQQPPLSGSARASGQQRARARPRAPADRDDDRPVAHHRAAWPALVVSSCRTPSRGTRAEAVTLPRNQRSQRNTPGSPGRRVTGLHARRLAPCASPSPSLVPRSSVRQRAPFRLASLTHLRSHMTHRQTRRGDGLADLNVQSGHGNVLVRPVSVLSHRLSTTNSVAADTCWPRCATIFITIGLASG